MLAEERLDKVEFEVIFVSELFALLSLHESEVVVLVAIVGNVLFEVLHAAGVQVEENAVFEVVSDASNRILVLVDVFDVQFPVLLAVHSRVHVQRLLGLEILALLNSFCHFYFYTYY